MNSQNGSTGHTGGGHFIYTVCHIHVLNHGHFTHVVCTLVIQINDLDMWKNIEKDMTEIVYDNKNLHITELEDTRPVFILFYLIY